MTDNRMPGKLRLTFAGCLAASLILLAVGPAAASSFPYYDDPNSNPVGTCCTVGGINNNDVTFHEGVHNVGAAHDILYAVTAFQDNNGPGDLSWNQSKGGWYGNVGGTTLLVTVDLPGFLPWSDVADAGGNNQETYTAFGETVGPLNAYPYFDVGTVGTGDTANFDVTFHFDWGDGRSGVTSTYWGFFETLAANPTYVPEPASTTLIGGGLALLGVLRRKRGSQNEF